MLYRVIYGDSPAIIARKFGVPFHALIRANPHKFLVHVAGVRTWRELVPGEVIRIPGALGVGDAASDAAQALASAGDPCSQDNVELVCQFQATHGIQPDGKYGATTATALKAVVPTAPGPCQHQSWWAPRGQSSCGALQQPALLATIALQALTADPNYCQSVRQPGSRVNRAIHNFKIAYNAANPGQQVPVGTGNYEQSVADAIQSLTAGTPPAGCGGPPMQWAPLQPGPVPTQGPPLNVPMPPALPAIPGVPNPPPAPLPAPPPAPIPSAPAASLSDRASQALAALNASTDHCGDVKRPGSAVNTTVHNFKLAWNAANPGNPVPVNTSNYEQVVADAISNTTGSVAPPGCMVIRRELPQPPPDHHLVLPEKAGISTGALIAGGIGAVALIGVAAVAANAGKKPSVRYRTRKAPKKRRKR